MTDLRTPGLALLCDRAGVIQRVLCDDVFPAGDVQPGQPLADRLDPDSREKASHLLAEVIAQGSAFDWELNVSLHGRVFTLHFSGVADEASLLIVAAHNRDNLLQFNEELMRINSEQVNALRQAIKDQTTQALTQDRRDRHNYDELSRLNNELIALQRELAKQNVELARLNQEKNYFLGMAAHDLRTPLSVILTYSEFLSQELAPSLTAEHREFLSIIRQSSQFMSGLLDDWLDVSAIEAGQLTLDLQWTDLAALVDHNVARNRILATQRQRQVIYTCAADVPPVLLIDPAKIEQVLNNLISNAIKYSFPATTIDVTLRRTDDQVVLSVHNLGPGIRAAETNRLFKAFSKASAKSSTGEKSTGLGLAIAHKIVQEHHGQIWVQSEEGLGATFFVALPITAPKESAL